MIKKLIASIVVLSLILMGIPAIPYSQAADTLQNVSDTLSDSKPSQTATHTFGFTISTATSSAATIEITASDFNWSAANGTCPDSGTFSTTTNGVKCTYGSGISTGNKTLTVSNVVNPATQGSYTMTVETKAGATTLESAQIRVAIVEGVTVSANVSAVLTFQVLGTEAGTTTEEGATDVSTTATTINFGTININTQYVAAQKLSVDTNADDGFTVKVWQNQNLTNAMNNDIDKFANGVTSTNPAAWTAPSASSTDENTFGHFGLRSDDDSVEKDYGSNSWIGFYGDGTNYQHEVFKHTGPAKGLNDNKNEGWTFVEYALEISALQEAGDYSNVLTYICTPTY